MKSTVIINMVTMAFLLDLDKIFVFEKGHLKEDGRPKELLVDRKSILHSEVNNIAPHLLERVLNRSLAR